MVFAFFMSLLLLITISGISSSSLQAVIHSILTGCCLLSGWQNALNSKITLLSFFMLFTVAIFFTVILKGQYFQYTLKTLFTGLFLTILAVSFVVHVLPPSLFRLEYGIVLSIILVGVFYSMSSQAIGGQIAGMLCVLNALTLVVGLNSQFYAFFTLFAFYVVFLLASIFIMQRFGQVDCVRKW